MIKAGIKLEEYREIKPYWKMRLTDQHPLWARPQSTWKFNNYDAVEFINGYAPDSPRFMVKCNGITIDEGNPEWGAEAGVQYFKILLGEPVMASVQKEQGNG